MSARTRGHRIGAVINLREIRSYYHQFALLVGQLILNQQFLARLDPGIDSLEEPEGEFHDPGFAQVLLLRQLLDHSHFLLGKVERHRSFCDHASKITDGPM